jgi:hypothetical protein
MSERSRIREKHMGKLVQVIVVPTQQAGIGYPFVGLDNEGNILLGQFAVMDEGPTVTWERVNQRTRTL